MGGETQRLMLNSHRPMYTRRGLMRQITYNVLTGSTHRMVGVLGHTSGDAPLLPKLAIQEPRSMDSCHSFNVCQPVGHRAQQVSNSSARNAAEGPQGRNATKASALLQCVPVFTLEGVLFTRGPPLRFEVLGGSRLTSMLISTLGTNGDGSAEHFWRGRF